jgi:hypothetical protein
MELSRKDAFHMRGRPRPLLTPTSLELPKDPPHLDAAISAFFFLCWRPRKDRKSSGGGGAMPLQAGAVPSCSRLMTW